MSLNAYISRAYAAAIKKLWTGTCTVTTLSYETDEDTGRETASETVLFSDEPCRISYSQVTTTDISDGAAKPAQTVTLYIAAENEIPEGAKITVTQSGVTSEYKRAGKSAVYTVHREIPLENFEDWA